MLLATITSATLYLLHQQNGHWQNKQQVDQPRPCITATTWSLSKLKWCIDPPTASSETTQITEPSHNVHLWFLLPESQPDTDSGVGLRVPTKYQFHKNGNWILNSELPIVHLQHTSYSTVTHQSQTDMHHGSPYVVALNTTWIHWGMMTFDTFWCTNDDLHAYQLLLCSFVCQMLCSSILKWQYIEGKKKPLVRNLDLTIFFKETTFRHTSKTLWSFNCWYKWISSICFFFFRTLSLFWQMWKYHMPKAYHSRFSNKQS